MWNNVNVTRLKGLYAINVGEGVIVWSYLIYERVWWYIMLERVWSYIMLERVWWCIMLERVWSCIMLERKCGGVLC